MGTEAKKVRYSGAKKGRKKVKKGVWGVDFKGNFLYSGAKNLRAPFIAKDKRWYRPHRKGQSSVTKNLPL